MEYAIAVIAVLIVLAVVVYHSKIAAAAKFEADRLRAEADRLRDDLYYRLHPPVAGGTSAPAVDPVPVVSAVAEVPAPVYLQPPSLPASGSLTPNDTLPTVNAGEGLLQYAQRVGFDSTRMAELTMLASYHPGDGWDVLVDRARNPGKYMTQADKDTIAAAQAQLSVTYHGPVAIGSLTDAEKLFISAAARELPRMNLAYDLLSGTSADIARVIDETSNLPGYGTAHMVDYPADGRLRQYL